MKPALLSLGVVVCLLAGCETTNFAPPPVTPQMAKTGRGQVDLATLEHGRKLFVSRCLECHVLPPVESRTAAKWPHTVDRMADRASLKPAERDAMVAYLQAAAK